MDTAQKVEVSVADIEVVPSLIPGKWVAMLDGASVEATDPDTARKRLVAKLKRQQKVRSSPAPNTVMALAHKILAMEKRKEQRRVVDHEVETAFSPVAKSADHEEKRRFQQLPIFVFADRPEDELTPEEAIVEA